jgi:AraC family transcriptional regulator, regulatory protein of adaptative response / methylated-DNA-[protein]-cysteine methyltransferase
MGMNNEQCWNYVINRDAAADGKFVTAVLTTRIYCRPSCPARHPLRKNVRFYNTPAEAETGGFRACKRCHPNEPDVTAARINDLCRFIETHPEDDLSLEALSQRAHLSPFHLQRVFKKAVGVSPKQYVLAQRTQRMRAGLKAGETVTASLYEAGYGSSSRVYEQSPLGMQPKVYQAGGTGMDIGFTIVDSPLGRMVVAATVRGVCFVGFGEKDKTLEAELRNNYPRATIEHNEGFKPWVKAILANLNGQQPRLDLPVDVRGTAFQQQVWAALKRIPYGKTQTYGELAEAIGRPTAARAVGAACGSNPVPIVVPCHRVVGSNGDLTGYRWGVERKKKLLAKEQSRA